MEEEIINMNRTFRFYELNSDGKALVQVAATLASGIMASSQQPVTIEEAINLHGEIVNKLLFPKTDEVVTTRCVNSPYIRHDVEWIVE